MSKLRKIASIALICIAVLNLLLLGFGLVRPLVFWVVLGAVAVVAKILKVY